MTPDQIKLYKEIDEILWSDWDPCGVNQFGVRDEYYSYLPQIYQLKINGADKIEIAKYLDKIIVERMGMESNMKFNEQIAEKIIALSLTD